MKWYIGQDVVCIKNHSQGFIKEGDAFTIQGLQQDCCDIILDVGFHSLNLLRVCTVCNKVTRKEDSTQWFGETLFVPLESMTDITEIEELLKEPIFQS